MLSDHLEKLVAFKAIANAGSFRRAAEDLRVTQPTLTRSVQTLESQLNRTLLDRSVKGVALTSEGELLLQYTEDILNKALDVERAIKNVSDKLAGVISVGTYESLSIYLWPRFLVHLKSKAPNLQIKLSTNHQINQIEELAARRIKMVVDAEPNPRPDMISIPLFHDHFNFYGNLKIKVDENTPFIYVSHAYDENQQSISQILRSKNIMHTLWYDVDSFETAKALALEGLGVAVLPTNVAQNSRRNLRLINIAGFNKRAFGKHTIYATFNIESKSDKRINAIISELKQFSGRFNK